jgi:hypothetical protein
LVFISIVFAHGQTGLTLRLSIIEYDKKHLQPK